jgi:transglutaminase-like putative cysteine protease
MRIKAGYRIVYETPGPTPMLLMLNVRPERAADLETPDAILTDPPLPIRTYRDGFGNICSRVLAPAGRTRFHTDFVIRDSGACDPVLPDAGQSAVEDLPDDLIKYLLPSRYCETERLHDVAWGLAGATPPGWARVQAVCDYTHERIRFGYEHARPTKTAYDAHLEQAGVCRDYAHLAITLCRCLNIPARYCTGYLGDIRVEVLPGPMDFSAWFEVWLGGAWRAFDARHNTPRIGRTLMGIGRDAADVAIITTFGLASLVDFEVFTDELVEP